MAKKERSNRIIGRRYRYTEDYRVVPALGRSGRQEKRVIYTAPWVVLRCEEAELRSRVLRMRILFAVAVLALIAALQVLPAPMENKWYVPVLMISVFPLAYQLLAVFTLPNEKKPMERQEYDKSFNRYRQSAVFALVMFCLAAVGTVVYWIVYAAGGLKNAAPYALGDAIFALLLASAAAAELMANRVARGVQTDTLENSAYSR